MGIGGSAQDTLGVMHTIPEEAKGSDHKAAAVPVHRRARLSPVLPADGRRRSRNAPIKKFDWYSDDHLWLILAVNAYVKETGDFEFLDQIVATTTSRPRARSGNTWSGALEFTDTWKGPHNIALWQAVPTGTTH